MRPATCAALSLSVVLLAVPAGGQPLPSLKDLREIAMQRFPQPVRVGDLVARDVKRHRSDQAFLGIVDDVVREPGGQVFVVVALGGWFAWSRRPVAVPVEAMAVNGHFLEVREYSPDQLDRLPTFEVGSIEPMPRDERIDLALSKPAH